MPQEPTRTARIASDALAVADQRAIADAIFNPPPLTPPWNAPSIAIGCSSSHRVDGAFSQLGKGSRSVRRISS